MIITLENGEEITLADVVKDPKAEAIEWLRRYKESLGRIPGSEPQSEKGASSNAKDCTTE